MIVETTEAKIARTISENIPTIGMHQFPNPPRFDGGEQPHYGFWNEDTGNCLQCFTSKENYSLTTQDDYVALASAAMDAMDCEGEVKAHWTESKSRAQATIIVCPSEEHRRDLYDVGGNDAVFPRLVIEAPFGRTFKVRGGFYRDACKNLDIPQLAGRSEGFETTIRHTSQLRSRMNELVALCRSSCGFESMISTMNELNEIDVKISDALAELYPLPEKATPNQLTRARSRAAAIYRRIHTEALSLDGKTREGDMCSSFRLVQAITGYVQHDKTRKKGMSEVDRAVMSINDVETSAAWKYAGALLAS